MKLRREEEMEGEEDEERPSRLASAASRWTACLRAVRMDVAAVRLDETERVGRCADAGLEAGAGDGVGGAGRDVLGAGLGEGRFSRDGRRERSRLVGLGLRVRVDVEDEDDASERYESAGETADVLVFAVAGRSRERNEAGEAGKVGLEAEEHVTSPSEERRRSCDSKPRVNRAEYWAIAEIAEIAVEKWCRRTRLG